MKTIRRLIVLLFLMASGSFGKESIHVFAANDKWMDYVEHQNLIEWILLLPFQKNTITRFIFRLLPPGHHRRGLYSSTTSNHLKHNESLKNMDGTLRAIKGSE